MEENKVWVEENKVSKETVVLESKGINTLACIAYGLLNIMTRG